MDNAIQVESFEVIIDISLYNKPDKRGKIAEKSFINAIKTLTGLKMYVD